MSIIADEIKARRKARGWSKLDLSIVAGLRLKQYNAKEAGKIAFEPRELADIRQAFIHGLQVYPHQLLTHCGQPLKLSLKRDEQGHATTFTATCEHCHKYIEIEFEEVI